jgi:hypothetical protein
MRTPSQPRWILPVDFNCATTFFAAFAGIAKPMPTEPPVGE